MEDGTGEVVLNELLGMAAAGSEGLLSIVFAKHAVESHRELGCSPVLPLLCQDLAATRQQSGIETLVWIYRARYTATSRASPMVRRIRVENSSRYGHFLPMRRISLSFKHCQVLCLMISLSRLDPWALTMDSTGIREFQPARQSSVNGGRPSRNQQAS